MKRPGRGKKGKEPSKKPANTPPSAVGPVKQEAKVSKARGRPMLSWVGKRPLERVTAFPAQLVEAFDPSRKKGGWQNLLFHGDNKEVLAHLLANGFRGKVNLVYIDPPFDSGADYVRRVSLRGPKGTAKLEAEYYTLGEQVQYSDIWANDNYLQFIYERLLLIKELLAEDSCIWVHCDWHKSHLIRATLDEVFGADHFVNEVIWKRVDAHNNANAMGAIHDTIFLYAKGDSHVWNPIFLPLPKSTIDTWYNNVEPETGRRYNKADLTAPEAHASSGQRYVWKGKHPPAGRVWAYNRLSMERLEREKRLVYSSSGMPYEKRYLDESKGVPLQDWWDDISFVRGIATGERTEFPTQKPVELIKRIIRLTSRADDLVLDCFVGSGTTALAAQEVGCRWIACDINKGAIQTTLKRLQTTIQNQFDKKQQDARQGNLIETGMPGNEPVVPASFSLAVYRVNDYDLQIQHNEALNLACEQVGIERIQSDSFFEGTLGKKLVKVIPFNHPVSQLDLEEIKRELKARPEEDRDVTVVSLGKESAVDAWLEDWNRLRKQGQVPNRIEVIELRTDPKYGKFFLHKPAKAKVLSRFL